MTVLTFAIGSSTFLDLIGELARTEVWATADTALAVGVDVTSVMLYYWCRYTIPTDRGFEKRGEALLAENVNFKYDNFTNDSPTCD